ncbi:MAG: prepilin-type N-terminal cleavage/methylation domain-containing protein [Planctomycetota bacterium]|nr:prepilin-type N-terminal cleavage/methylation domain-containing protein [Planctomycetota bacterium]
MNGPVIAEKQERVCGFTLIEILVALMVFMAGMAGVLALFSTGLKLHRDGQDVSYVTRHFDEVARTLEEDLAAGKHWNADKGGWDDVSATTLLDGTSYSAVLVGEQGNERHGSVLALIRMAPRPGGLLTSRPVPFVLDPTKGLGDAISDYRRRISR